MQEFIVQYVIKRFTKKIMRGVTERTNFVLTIVHIVEKMTERGVVQIPLCFLAKSLENMSLCHAAYFCTGWENARGCRIEHDAAVAYGLEVIEE